MVSVCLVEQNIFFREGIKQLLSDTQYLVDNVYSDWPNVENNMGTVKDTGLFIMDCSMVKAGAHILKQSCPSCRVIVFADHADIDSVAAAFTAGVDGYLLRSILPQALIGSLDMVLAGEKVCPAAVLNMLSDQSALTGQGNNAVGAFSGHNLSAREIQILRFLADGDSNKQIARNLEITEATVKVHIKAILRKLDVSNRTQAAVWAVNKGLHDTDEQHDVDLNKAAIA